MKIEEMREKAASVKLVGDEMKELMITAAENCQSEAVISACVSQNCAALVNALYTIGAEICERLEVIEIAIRDREEADQESSPTGVERGNGFRRWLETATAYEIESFFLNKKF